MLIEINGVRTEVVVEGEGPPLTLVHGVAFSLESHRSHVSRLYL